MPLVLIFCFISQPLLFSQNKYAIAVLDFYSNVGNISEDSMLQTGTADTIISDLMNIKDFQVIERSRLKNINQELAYQHSGMVDDSTAIEIGKQVGAEYLIYGSWQKSGNQYRINARLVSVKTGEIVTSVKETNYDIFKIQDSIVDKVINTLNINVNLSTLAKIRTNETNSLEAYKEYSKGLKAVDRGDQLSIQNHMKRAVEIDPNYEKPKKYLYSIGVVSIEAKTASEARFTGSLLSGLMMGCIFGGIGYLFPVENMSRGESAGYAFGGAFAMYLVISFIIGPKKVNESKDKLCDLGFFLNPKTDSLGMGIRIRF